MRPLHVLVCFLVLFIVGGYSAGCASSQTVSLQKDLPNEKMLVEKSGGHIEQVTINKKLRITASKKATAEKTLNRPSSLAIMRFNNTTGDKNIDWLGAGIAETLTTELAASGKFSVVEKEQIDKVIGELKFELSGLVDPSTAQEIGKILGVEYVILGSYQKYSGVYRIMARKVETKTGKVQETTTVTGPEAEIFDLEEELARKLLKNTAL